MLGRIRLQPILYAIAAVAIMLVGLRALGDDHSPAASRARGPVQAASAGSSGAGGATAAVRIERDEAPQALVHVAGAVRRPGVYRLPAGARVVDAVERAGGARPGADLDAINLAAELRDGQQIVVARRGAAGAGAGAPAGEAAATGANPPAAAGAGAKVNLNTATVEQLDAALDGVGPVIAHKIVAWRQEHGGFRSVEDLAQVPGIGPKRMAALRDGVAV